MFYADDDAYYCAVFVHPVAFLRENDYAYDGRHVTRVYANDDAHY